jgi:hypothetical protein
MKRVLLTRAAGAGLSRMPVMRASRITFPRA